MSVGTPAEQKALEDACNLYYLRILEGVERQLEPAKQWWPIATLCAVAIDAMSTATSVDGISAKSTYIEYLKKCPALGEYAPFAERFYASLRSGLVHSLIPSHGLPKIQKSKKPNKSNKTKRRKRYRPVAISDECKPPYLAAEPSHLRRDYLIIGAPHLLQCTKRMLDDFRKGPITRQHRRFMKRFVQVVWDETPTGLVRKP